MEVWLALKELLLFKLLAVLFVFCVLLGALFACWLLPLLFVLVKSCVFVLQMSVLLLCKLSCALLAILIESVLSVKLLALMFLGLFALFRITAFSSDLDVSIILSLICLFNPSLFDMLLLLICLS